MTQTFEVATPLGPGRWHLDPAENPRANLLLGHGAGGGVTAMDLALLAAELPQRGIGVLRYEQPWRLAGRKVATPPPQLDTGWRAGVQGLADRGVLDAPLLFGGRSAGARVACRTAVDDGTAGPDRRVIGIVCLAFPLHLPGRPDKSRAAELLAPTVPRLVLQGTRDTFGTAEEIRAVAAVDPAVVLVELPGADHGYRTPKAAPFTPADLRDRLVQSLFAFVEALTGDAQDDGPPASGSRPRSRGPE
ncbi:MAG TPA: alpha/beta family hydrolase [Microlunatus sp.]|nr:alpha/beta family hydrolase [Microlunatus sp.]